MQMVARLDVKSHITHSPNTTLIIIETLVIIMCGIKFVHINSCDKGMQYNITVVIQCEVVW